MGLILFCAVRARSPHTNTKRFRRVSQAGAYRQTNRLYVVTTQIRVQTSITSTRNRSTSEYAKVTDKTELFETIDRLVCLDIGGRGIRELYQPARQRGKGPLSQQAVEHLASVTRGDCVFIITGSLSRAQVTPRIAENDGPLGAAAIARALSIGRGAIPVLLTDEPIRERVAAVAGYAGCNVLTPEEAAIAAALPRATTMVTSASISATCDLAEHESGALLERFQPKAVISIERAGWTADGTYRNALGQDYSEGRARLDHVVELAQASGIPTIGIGDGGNEIGMGAVKAAVHAHVPHGPVLCAEVATDVLIPAGVSNWGGYAIAAALAISDGNADLAHTPDRERRLLEAAPGLGLIDGTTGRTDPTGDGMPMSVHLAVSELLLQLVRRGCSAA